MKSGIVSKINFLFNLDPTSRLTFKQVELELLTKTTRFHSSVVK